MGTHPIFESDFDCLTEWNHFIKMDEDYYDVTIYYKPTVEHCHLATLIGLFIREKIRREIPPDYFRYKLKILAMPGTLQNEDDANRQVNDKERVAAALEKESMTRLVDQCINNEEG